MNPNNQHQFQMVNRSHNDSQGHVGHAGNVPMNQSNSFQYYPQQQKSSQMFKPWQANQIIQQNHNQSHHYSNIEETRGMQQNPSQKSIHNFSN